MAWSAGPGEITQISFGGNAITADLLEPHSLTTEPDTYASALGHDVERGGVRKTLTVSAYDVSQINAINTLMTARTESSVVITYNDSQTQTLSNCIIRITPLLHQVSDVCNVYLGSSTEANEDLPSGGAWVDLGVSLDLPTVDFRYVFDGVDGCGRPYYSMVGMDFEVILPGDAYGDITQGAQARIAIAMPDGNYQVMDVRTYKFYADEDGSQPRAIRLMGRAVGDDWGDFLEFTDAAVSPGTVTETFTASSPTLIQDRIHGMEIEVTGYDYSEGNLVTF